MKMARSMAKRREKHHQKKRAAWQNK